MIRKLLEAAKLAQSRAHAPYSNYPVGAALLCADGTIVLGCNVESRAYPTTMCAERTAIFSAFAQGKTEFVEMMLITKDGGMPCGACRQVLYENATKLRIHVSDGHSHKTFLIKELLPEPF